MSLGPRGSGDIVSAAIVDTERLGDYQEQNLKSSQPSVHG